MKIFIATAAAYVFAVVVGHLCVAAVVDQLWAGLTANPRKSSNVRPAAYLPRLVGLLERALYLGAFQFGKAEFVGVWLALKVAGQWKRWGEPTDYDGQKIDGRTFYNIFLVGNGLSVAYAAVSFQFIQESRNCLLWALIYPVSLLIGTRLLLQYVRRCQDADLR